MAALQQASDEGRRGSLDVLWPDGVPARLRQAFDEAMAADASEEVDLRDIRIDSFSQRMRMIMIVALIMVTLGIALHMVAGNVWQDHWRLLSLAMATLVVLCSVCALFGIRPLETSAAVCSQEGLTTSSIFGTRTFRSCADHAAVCLFSRSPTLKEISDPEQAGTLIVVRSADGRISSVGTTFPLAAAFINAWNKGGGTVSDHGAADPTASPSPEPSESRDHA